MLKRFARDFFIVFGISLLWASTSHMAMKLLSERRHMNTWWGLGHAIPQGDLVELGSLGAVQKFNSSPAIAASSPRSYHDAKNTVLYLYGDSYTWSLTDSVFSGVCVFHYINRYDGGFYHTDTTKRNILIFEIAERDFRAHFNDLKTMDFFRDSVKCTGTFSRSGSTRFIPSTNFTVIGLNDFFSKQINQNLQFNLFAYNCVAPLFEYKAALNYYVFKRASGQVVISDDGNFLFLKGTVDKSDSHSSYYPIYADEIEILINNINKIYDFYKQNGFKEIYLSIIPNPATIMQPEGYNNLIPLIQADPRLKMKIIDIYSIFKNSGEVYYLPGDTHWNTKGKQRWLDEVNKKLVD